MLPPARYAVVRPRTIPAINARRRNPASSPDAQKTAPHAGSRIGNMISDAADLHLLAYVGLLHCLGNCGTLDCDTLRCLGLGGALLLLHYRGILHGVGLLGSALA